MLFFRPFLAGKQLFPAHRSVLSIYALQALRSPVRHRFVENTQESDQEQAKQSTSSRLREAQERLQRLEEKTEALRETQATLSKEVQEVDGTLVKAAVDQLQGGTKTWKSKSWRWDRLVVLTAKWRYGGDDKPIGLQPDLKKSLSFAASLRLARNVNGKLSTRTPNTFRRY
ncbi:hypothetical protein L218DRAFT_952164 [Marasmius fiardii PR-910]|nr:hypothetical protein L218DRAFT_952164 [Marasmius fiardii PR-910]